MSISNFPVELLKLIAVELSDTDLCSFSLAYRTFHDAVEGDQMVWRTRLLRVYDAPMKKRKNAHDWGRTYQARKRLLNQELRQMEFEAGNSKKEQEVLEVLQDLLLDARGYLESDSQTITGRNFHHIYLSNPPPSISLAYLHDSPNPLLQVINLLLTPTSNRPNAKDIPRLQAIVYNPQGGHSTIADGFPNLHVLEALAQFFTHHIHPSSESLVFHQKTLLDPSELPSFWEGNLGDEPRNIPTKWFGAYTYPMLLRGSQDLVFDRSDGHLVDMTLSFSASSHLSCLEHKFTGTGLDFSPFSVKSGKITPLPSPPGTDTITGWNKVQFVKNYRSHMWVYEGVMLPGNNMILGHWRHGLDEVFAPRQSGPFVFWAAPEGSSLESRDNRLSLNRVRG